MDEGRRKIDVRHAFGLELGEYLLDSRGGFGTARNRAGNSE